MIPGRDDSAKKEIAVKVQPFLAKDLNMDEKFVSVSIEDVKKEEWTAHMERLQDKKMLVDPGV